MKYIELRGSTYYYRRRIPSKLSKLIPVNILYRSLSKDKRSALKIATKYDHMFNMIDIGLKLSQDVSAVINELSVDAAPLPLPTTPAKKSNVDVFTMYRNSLNVSEKRMSKVSGFIETFREFMPSDFSDVTMTKLDKVKEQLQQLPRGTISKYKKIPKSKLVTMKIPKDELLSNDTINGSIKVLNAILKFAYERDLMNKHLTVKTLSLETSARDQREALPKEHITAILEQARSVQLHSAYKILYLSGMRPSEAYKCNIITVDGVECFDLSDKSIPLKTRSSHRIIPVHSDITDPHKALDDLRSFKIQNLGRQFKKDTNGGSLYSLRHSFATHLAKSVEPHIISELLGHTHKDMTLSRYVKRFDVSVLHEAVNRL